MIKLKAIDYIKNSLDDSIIKELLLNSGARSVKKIGREIRCSCPIHKGNNTTAFTWNLENNLWFCFTGDCGKRKLPPYKVICKKNAL